MSVFVKNIEIERQGNNVYALVSGQLSSGYQVSNTSAVLNGTTIEVSIKAKAPSGIHAQVMGRLQQRIYLGSFYPGKYAVRVNGNNQYVKWFQ